MTERRVRGGKYQLERERLTKTGPDREGGGGERERWRQTVEERSKKEERYKWKACSSPARWQLWQHAVMAVLQYGASPPDCHAVVEANSAITLLMCVFCMTFSGTSESRQHMVLKTQS